MYELSPTVKAAADGAAGGGDFDVAGWAFNNLLQKMIRDQLDADEEYANPIVNNEIAKIIAPSISGYGV